MKYLDVLKVDYEEYKYRIVKDINKDYLMFFTILINLLLNYIWLMHS